MNINNKTIGPNYPTYFIADIAANHDGDLNRAKDLIFLAAEAGADAAKFQHFAAETIVSDYGFKALGSQQSHQASWKKSVFEVYKDASINLEWTQILKDTCDKANIAFFTSPYSIELVDYVDKYVPAYKIGSGDITWHEIIKYISNKQKPIILASGASDIKEVTRAVSIATSLNKEVALLQCNTNYTGSLDNFKYINLRTLITYKSLFPEILIGLSDHTPFHSTVLGAVSLGAKIIEKHFTDNNSRNGPDHAFSMNPSTWGEMIARTRELELSLGDGCKKIELNEEETVILQRRALYLTRDLKKGSIINREDLIPLRPCLKEAVPVDSLEIVIGKATQKDIKSGQELKWKDLN